MKMNTIGFIGGGRVTRIILNAFKKRSVKFYSIFVYDPNKEVIANLLKQFPDVVNTKVIECARQDIVVLAVHPPVMMETLSSIKATIHPQSVVLSLAPKFNVSTLSEVLSTNKIIRMIPNATSYINKGYNPVYFNYLFDNKEKSEFFKIFESLGDTFEVEESKLESYAIVSAMLPTYFWFQWEKMEEIATRTGLSKQEAIATVENTLRYAIDIFYQSDQTHEEVMDLIPVKPIGEHEAEINSIYENKLIGLFEKIRSMPAAEAV